MDTPTPPDVKLPSKRALAELDTLESTIEQDEAERAKQRRETRQRFIEKHHVHVGAFELARKLKAMEPVARNAYLRHFAHYVEALGLDKQLDLFQPPVAEQVAHMAQAGAVEGLGGSRARA